MKICPKCGKEHLKDGVFCCRSCANSRVCTPENKLKKSLALKGRKGLPCKNKGFRKNGIPDDAYKFKIYRICLNCLKSFLTNRYGKTKYCCLKCNPLVGGFRKNSGRSKSGHYKGIYSNSTYELCWIIYNLDHGIKFERFPSFLEKDGVKYYPDFLLDDKKTIIEINGYEKKEVTNNKIKIAESNGFVIKVLYKEDLKLHFDYVAEKYSKNYASLYDDYKPSFQYVCNHCNIVFNTDRKRTTKSIFCSRRCSGLRSKKI